MNITMTPLDMQVQQRQLEHAIDHQQHLNQAANAENQPEQAGRTAAKSWTVRLAGLFLTPRPAG